MDICVKEQDVNLDLKANCMWQNPLQNCCMCGMKSLIALN